MPTAPKPGPKPPAHVPSTVEDFDDYSGVLWHRGVCSCGRYRSKRVGSDHKAQRLAAAHARDA